MASGAVGEASSYGDYLSAMAQKPLEARPKFNHKWDCGSSDLYNLARNLRQSLHWEAHLYLAKTYIPNHMWCGFASGELGCRWYCVWKWPTLMPGCRVTRWIELGITVSFRPKPIFQPICGMGFASGELGCRWHCVWKRLTSLPGYRVTRWIELGITASCCFRFHSGRGEMIWRGPGMCCWWRSNTSYCNLKTKNLINWLKASPKNY